MVNPFERQWLPPGGGLYGFPGSEYINSITALRNQEEEARQFDLEAQLKAQQGRGMAGALGRGAAGIAGAGGDPQAEIEAISRELLDIASGNADKFDPDHIDALATRLEELRAQPREFVGSMAPGGQAGVFSPHTGQLTNVRQTPTTEEQLYRAGVPTEAMRNAGLPTEKTRTFEQFAEMAGLSQEEKMELAHMSMLSDAADASGSSAKERAAQRLVERGVISQDTADKFIATGFIITSMPDKFGTPQRFITDLATQQTIPLEGGASQLFEEMGIMQRQSGVPSPGLGGVSQPEDVQPTERQLPGLDDPTFGKAAMVLGVGPGGIASEYAGIFGRMVDPTLTTGHAAANQRQQMRIVRTAVMGLRDQSEGMGIPIRIIERMEELTAGLGVVEDSLDNTAKLISLRNMINNQIEQAEKELADPTSAPQTRVKASNTRRNFRTVLSELPEMEQLWSMYDALGGGKVKTTTPAEIIKEITDLRRTAEGAVEEVQREFRTTSGIPDEEFQSLLAGPNAGIVAAFSRMSPEQQAQAKAELKSR